MVKSSLTLTPEHFMIYSTARELKDGEIVFVGTGLPLRAAYFAQRTHAPSLVIVNEMGVAYPKLTRAPVGVTDPAFVMNASYVSNMLDALGVILPRVDVAIVGAAQIDKYGNLNTTVIGDYFQPKVRLVGSGGASDILSVAKRVIVIMRHEKSRFVEKVDYVTSVGHIVNGKTRKELGLLGNGPSAVISNLGIMRFDNKTKEMYVAAIYPGIPLKMIKENTGFEIKVASDVHEVPVPTRKELEILHEISEFFSE